MVAMVGVLAAIAIPQYSKFTARARQAEAKINLAAAYTALQGFAAENGSYTICLKQAGYLPDGPDNNCGPTRYYAIGFDENYYGTIACGPGGNLPCGYTSFLGRAPRADGSGCAFGNTDGCCTSGWVGGGGCGSIWPISQSDMQFPANATLTNIGSGPVFPGHGQLSALGTFVNQNQFKLGAAGSISPSPSGSTCLNSVLWYNTMDGWTIDQNKTLINTHSCL